MDNPLGPASLQVSSYAPHLVSEYKQVGMAAWSLIRGLQFQSRGIIVFSFSFIRILDTQNEGEPTGYIEAIVRLIKRGKKRCETVQQKR